VQAAATLTHLFASHGHTSPTGVNGDGAGWNETGVRQEIVPARPPRPPERARWIRGCRSPARTRCRPGADDLLTVATASPLSAAFEFSAPTYVGAESNKPAPSEGSTARVAGSTAALARWGGCGAAPRRRAPMSRIGSRTVGGEATASAAAGIGAVDGSMGRWVDAHPRFPARTAAELPSALMGRGLPHGACADLPHARRAASARCCIGTHRSFDCCPIRDAVQAVYGTGRSSDDDLADMRRAFGSWKHRDLDGAEWVDQLRSGSRRPAT